MQPLAGMGAEGVRALPICKIMHRHVTRCDPSMLHGSHAIMLPCTW